MEAFSVETNSKVHYKSSDLLEIMKGYQDGKVELQIIVSFNKPEEAVSSYKERWQIETAFYDKHIIMQSWRQSHIDIQ